MKRRDNGTKKSVASFGVFIALCVLVTVITTDSVTVRAAQENDLTIQGITCWGDSLTAGTGGRGTNYPSVLQSLLKADGYAINVINMGNGSEKTTEIMARAGVLKILANSFQIPADITPVQISFSSENGSKLSFLRYDGNGITNVIVGGIKGKLSIQQESPKSKNYTYYFTRNQVGEPLTVPQGMQIVNDGSYLYRNYIPVIFMGQNGGWSTPQDLIKQQQAILDTYGSNKDLYIIVGLQTGTAESRAALEKEMVRQWGNHYINLRSYLSSYGVYDANLTPSQDDLNEMQLGKVPKILRSDDIHLNATGYKLLAKLVYEKFLELSEVH